MNTIFIPEALCLNIITGFENKKYDIAEIYVWQLYEALNYDCKYEKYYSNILASLISCFLRLRPTNELDMCSPDEYNSIFISLFSSFLFDYFGPEFQLSGIYLKLITGSYGGDFDFFDDTIPSPVSSNLELDKYIKFLYEKFHLISTSSV